MCSLGTSQQRLERQIDFFKPFTPKNAVILEIGCATGELAAAVRKALSVRRYEGVELSPAASEAAKCLDKIYAEPLGDLVKGQCIEDAKFDIVLMSHVLEHIWDIAAEIEAIKRVLKPGGVLFLEVPNGAGHRRLPIDDNRAHLHFFSTSSLTRLLANKGLETVAAATDVPLDSRYADSLQVIARKFSMPNWQRGFLSSSLHLAESEKVVVWGAGSLAEEILANFFDIDLIDFFVDKNPAKQGQLCLGRPVRAPDALGNEPRTIIVNSIDFAPSIVADIRRLYPASNHKIVRISDLF